MGLMSLVGIAFISAASLVWLIACLAILYAALSKRWGSPHELVQYMAILLVISFVSYLMMVFSDITSVKEIMYRLLDGIGYAFVFLALLVAIDYSQRPNRWEAGRVRLLQGIALIIVAVAIFNPLGAYISDYSIVEDGYSYVMPEMEWLAAALILFALICSLFTIILPFQAFTSSRSRYHETLTLISAGGFILLLASFYLNFDIIDGDPLFVSLSLYTVFLIIIYMASIRLNIHNYDPCICSTGLDEMMDVVVAIDPEGKVAYANLPAERLFSSCFEKMRGGRMEDVLPPECLGAMGHDQRTDLIKLESDGQLRTFNVIRFPLRGNGGRDLGTAFMFREVTDVMHYHDSVRIALDKLELLNSISRHDMLNHMTVIHGYAELAMVVEDKDKRMRYLEKILDGCLKAEGIVNFNRSYKGMGTSLDWINLPKVIEQALKEADIGQLMEVSTEIEDVDVYADALISRAIYNIIQNSSSHAEGAQNITIKTGWFDSNSDFFIIVEDDGSGIPQDEKELIFRNGYGRTTGFGLFLTKEILEISKAKIWEEGAEGARFVISFPRENVRKSNRDTIY